jgi:uncharacterized protein (DUF3084 family)
MADFKPRGGTNTMKVERTIKELRQMESQARDLQLTALTLALNSRQLITDLESLLPKQEEPGEAERPEQPEGEGEAQGTLG